MEKSSEIERAPYEPDAVTVTGRAADGFLSPVNANGHELLADEPEAHGGSDQGPTPYDFLAAALGSCTVMTLNMYARRKEWPLEKVKVSLTHDRIHAKDCEDCESGDGQVHVLNREIRIEGNLDEAQRQRLLEIADRCPVHRTLVGEIKVRTRLA
jgi:putative redox protein